MSFLALIFAVIALIITFLRIDVTISNETFIGIVASFVGAAATIIVGAQIYNSIETKKAIDKLENTQITVDKYLNDLSSEKEELKNDSKEIKSTLHIAQALAYMDNNPVGAYYDLIISINWALCIYNIEGYKEVSRKNIDASFYNMDLILKEAEEKGEEEINSDEIKNEIESVKLHNAFYNIEIEFNRIEKERKIQLYQYLIP